MTKELASVGIFLLITIVSFYGIVVLWPHRGRAGRAAATVGIGAAYLALTYLLSLWAQAGGWPEGMFFMMAAVFIVPPVVVAFVVILIVALFGGGDRGWRKIVMALSFAVLALILLAFAFNTYLRLGWYAKDLDSPDPRVRAYAVLMVGETGLTAAEPMVLAAVHDSSPEVRKNALLALASIDDPETVGVVRTALSDEDPSVREMAIIAIVPLGRGGPEVVADLKRMLTDPDPGVREAAAGSLDSLDPTWRDAPDIPEPYRRP